MKLFILTLLVWFGASCSNTVESRVDALPYRVMASGLRLQSEVSMTTNKQAQIENGLRLAANKARCRGYFKELHPSDFRVAVIAPTETRSGVNVITYNGGYIAGLYYVERDTLVLVDQPDLTEITEHESTHRIYFFNDRTLYEATKKHEGNSIVFDMPPCSGP